MNEGIPLYAAPPRPVEAIDSGRETQCLNCHNPISRCTCTKPRDLPRELTLCLVCGMAGSQCICRTEEDL